MENTVQQSTTNINYKAEYKDENLSYHYSANLNKQYKYLSRATINKRDLGSNYVNNYFKYVKIQSGWKCEGQYYHVPELNGSFSMYERNNPESQVPVYKHGN